jgi:chaperonin GroES
MLYPLRQRILVKPVDVEVEEQTPGGIFIPEEARQTEKANEGVVVKLGSGWKLPDGGVCSDFHVQEGDRVIFAEFTGVEIEDEGVGYLILTEDDVIAIQRED